MLYMLLMGNPPNQRWGPINHGEQSQGQHVSWELTAEQRADASLFCYQKDANKKHGPNLNPLTSHLYGDLMDIFLSFLKIGQTYSSSVTNYVLNTHGPDWAQGLETVLDDHSQHSWAVLRVILLTVTQNAAVALSASGFWDITVPDRLCFSS